MITGKRLKGNLAEDKAACYLQQNGYKIEDRNFACRGGEIDIIARKNGALVFVEVKARRSEAFGGPEAAVTSAKQKRLALAAMWYIKTRKPEFESLMFDIIAVPDNGNIRHTKNAFVPDNFIL